MSTSGNTTSRRRSILLAGLLAGVTAATSAVAQSEAPATRPVFPELQRLNLECVSLYQRMQGSVLRVQMPAPWWNNDIDNDPRFNKFKLNPDVKHNLQQRANRGNYIDNNEQTNRGNAVPPATAPAQPAGSKSPDQPQQIQGGNSLDNKGQQGYTIIVPQPQIAEQAQQQQAALNATPGNKLAFAANNVGLLLSDRHVLVPAYVEREAIGDQPIRLAFGDGEPVFATLIGSDPQTQLTVLQLTDQAAAGEKARARDAARAAGAPVTLTDKQLPDGSVVLMLSPVDGSARLSVWTSTSRDVGVVVTIEGQIAGIARHGQFLSGGACQLIADQIIRHGAVRRATLGVIISQVDANDPARQNAELGQSPAVRVDQVMKGSVADRGGLRQGDLILSLAGEPVHNIPTLAAAIAARQGPTEVKVIRDGKIMSMRVDLVQK